MNGDLDSLDAVESVPLKNIPCNPLCSSAVDCQLKKAAMIQSIGSIGMKALF